MSLKLRELIIAVRMGKTNAEERAIIQKECAAIRDSLKNGKESHRNRNMLKLMYISMLGYSTDFAQMDVVNLLAQPDYGDKRVGYLTLCVLLDETTETLTLAENVIKKDLSDKQIFTQALALNTVANVAGEDMARDVMNEVVNNISSTSPTVKKKACLAGLRIVRKVPEFAEVFLDKMTDIFNDKQHGCLVSGLALVNHCLESEHGEPFLKTFRGSTSQAIRLLKGLVLSVSTMDHDVSGIADPFLQVELLRFFRVIAKDCKTTSDSVNDVLAQVATNTEGAKNAGAAILYECSRTIFAIHADDGLKNLGINILARFLTNARDNNLRYVALSTLLRIYPIDSEAVGKHQATIIDCLKDIDLSIRRRALELTVALIDTTSVRMLVPDLLAYLTVCGEEMRAEVAQSVCAVIEKQAPTPEWRVEMSLRVFREARVGVKDSFAKSFIGFLTNQTKSAQEGATQTLWEELSVPFDASLACRHALLLAGVWCIGEFGDLLANKNGGGAGFAENIASTIYAITNGVDSSLIKQYGLTALAKIVTKFPTTYQLVSSVFEIQSRSLDCELQQRACEYVTMLESFMELAQFSLSTIPPIVASEEAPTELAGDGLGAGGTGTAEVPATKPSSGGGDDLFGGPSTTAPSLDPAPAQKKDAFDDLFGGGGPSPQASAPPPPPPPPKPATGSVDDLFGPSSSTAAAAPSLPTPAPSSSGGAGGMGDLFGGGSAQQSQPSPSQQDWGAPVSASPPTPKRVGVHSGAQSMAHLSVLNTSGSPGNFSSVKAQLEISPQATGSNLSSVQVLIAVPKTTVIEILPLTNTTATSGNPVQQQMNLNFANDPNKGATILLKVRVMFNGGVTEEFTVSQPTTNLV